MPETTTPGAAGQAAAPAQTAAQPSGATAPAAAPETAPSQAGATKAAESPREAAIRKSAESWFAKKGGPAGNPGARDGEEAGDGTTGKGEGSQKAAAPGQAPKPHPNSNAAKDAAKLQESLDDARHVLRRAGKDMAAVDTMPDSAILMLAEQQRAIDRFNGTKGSKPPEKPAETPAKPAKGTGEGPDDLLPAEPDDDPLAEPSPKPKTSGLTDSLRKHLDDLSKTDPDLESEARGLFRQVKDHYTARVTAAEQQVKSLENDLRATLNLVAESRLDLVFQSLASDFPPLADPEARKALTETYQRRWDPDLTKLLGDPKHVLEDFRMLAARQYGTKATPDENPTRGQPPSPGNTGRGGPQPSLTREEVLRESATIFARKDLSPEQKNAEVEKLKRRMR